jgi:hypothetical protein
MSLTPASVKPFQPLSLALDALTVSICASERLVPTFAAARWSASTALSVDVPASDSSPLIVDDAEITRQLPPLRATPRVTRPPSAAGRPPTVWRSVTACPAPPASWLSATRARSSTERSLNSALLPSSQVRAASTAVAAETSLPSEPLEATRDDGVPKRFQAIAAPRSAAAERCAALGLTTFDRTSTSGAPAPWSIGSPAAHTGAAWNAAPAATTAASAIRCPRIYSPSECPLPARRCGHARSASRTGGA